MKQWLIAVGHGMSIGSEMSGGVCDVLVRDYQPGPLTAWNTAVRY